MDIFAIADADASHYKDSWSMGTTSDPTKRDGSPMLWFNAEPFHVGAAALAVWQKTVLGQLLAGNSTDFEGSVEVNVKNHPLGTAYSEGNIFLLVLGE